MHVDSRWAITWLHSGFANKSHHIQHEEIYRFYLFKLNTYNLQTVLMICMVTRLNCFSPLMIPLTEQQENWSLVRVYVFKQVVKPNGTEEPWRIVHQKDNQPDAVSLEIPDLTPFTQYR